MLLFSVISPQHHLSIYSMLPATTSIYQVTLRTRRLTQLTSFYQNILGLKEIRSSAEAAWLSASGQEPTQLILVQDDTALPLNRRSPGLYHAAWLVPNRQQLALVLQHLLQSNYRLQGASDHLVSEALYLADPDGNGIEIYCDRPPATWPRQNGQVQMATLALNLPELLAEIEAETPWQGLAPETKIGHIHLQVSALEPAKAFYVDLLGFAIMQSTYPGALFIAANGYHHHIGLNTWHSQLSAPAPPNQSGLVNFTIHVPDADYFTALQQQLRTAGLSLEVLNEKSFSFRDPDNLQVIIQG